MEPGTDTAWRKWNAPECPFQIEYSTRVLEEIRLGVMDAFFSLPRGGAEIGGILLGKHEGQTLSIQDYEALECEHAMGPSFTLSAKDQANLADMIARARRNPANRQPIGWYHSHTRSEIFLSETDQDIHKRYFPEPWQLALVLKPHTFEPMRGGFFFREPDGSFRGEATYQQFVVDALAIRPAAPAGGNPPPQGKRPTHDDPPPRTTLVEAPPEPPAAQQPPALPPPTPLKRNVPITREIPVEPLFAQAHEASPEGDPDTPAFLQLKQEQSWPAIKVAALLAVGLAAGGVGYQTREYWLPQVMSKARAVLPREPDSYVSLSVTDDNGQLRILWDRNAPAIRNALEGTIEITDGHNAPQLVRLDGAHLAAGAFSYARESERVDVVLIAAEPTGQQIKEQTSFLGKLPPQKGSADPALRKADTQAERAEKLQKDLNSQAAKTRKLEKDLKDMRDELEQKRRLENQSTDTKKND